VSARAGLDYVCLGTRYRELGNLVSLAARLAAGGARVALSVADGASSGVSSAFLEREAARLGLEWLPAAGLRDTRCRSLILQPRSPERAYAALAEFGAYEELFVFNGRVEVTFLDEKRLPRPPFYLIQDLRLLRRIYGVDAGAYLNCEELGVPALSFPVLEAAPVQNLLLLPSALWVGRDWDSPAGRGLFREVSRLLKARPGRYHVKVHNDLKMAAKFGSADWRRRLDPGPSELLDLDETHPEASLLGAESFAAKAARVYGGYTKAMLYAHLAGKPAFRVQQSHDDAEPVLRFGRKRELLSTLRQVPAWDEPARSSLDTHGYALPAADPASRVASLEKRAEELRRLRGAGLGRFAPAIDIFHEPRVWERLARTVTRRLRSMVGRRSAAAPAEPSVVVSASGLVSRDAYQAFHVAPSYETTGLNAKSRRKLSALEASLGGVLAGRTFMDIGCHHGMLCFKAVELGAASALGIDREPERALRIDRAARELGAGRVSFRQGEFPRIDASADVVLVLSVLHHLFDQTGSLDAIVARLAALTRHTLLIEWIAPEDASVSLERYAWRSAGAYTEGRFLEALGAHFAGYERVASGHRDTRHLYRCRARVGSARALEGQLAS
jgi:2-polyprenyl-3-methyl-5-hydroxy-6-metoxy-1,4-benzoquinol methylase